MGFRPDLSSPASHNVFLTIVMDPVPLCLTMMPNVCLRVTINSPFLFLSFLSFLSFFERAFAKKQTMEKATALESQRPFKFNTRAILMDVYVVSEEEKGPAFIRGTISLVPMAPWCLLFFSRHITKGRMTNGPKRSQHEGHL